MLLPGGIILPTRETPAAQESPTPSLRKILHIEDSETDAFIVRRGLRAVPGVAIDWVPTGAEGIERAERQEYDLVLLDYALPDMTGLEVLASLQQRAPALPVVVVSGFGSEYVAARGLHLGAIGFVNKDSPEFKETLAVSLGELWKTSLERRRARSIEERVRDEPTFRSQIESVLTDLREVLPEARGSFVASIDGFPLAVSRRGDERDVDILSAMATASVLKNLDIIGSSFELANHRGGVVHYDRGSLLFHKLTGVGSLVVVLDRQASWKEDGLEVEQAVKEIEQVILG